MRITQNFILILFVSIFTLFSCNDNNHNSRLLSEAEYLLENNPDKALLFLDSIDSPQTMDKNAYMRYIVTSVAIKKETQADITSDTIIFEAQKYFKDKKDYKNYALSNYYAGWVYYVNNNPAKALEAFMSSAYSNQQTKNDLLTAKSFNNIGYIYFEKDLFDSAIVNYKKALPYFDKVENMIERKLVTLINIGSAYEVSNKSDSSIIYFNKCLSLAKESKNEVYQFHSLKNLAARYLHKQNYTKAVDYFQSALAIKTSDKVDELEYSKIHLALLQIYNEQHSTGSAKEYADLVIASISKVTYTYTLQDMYSALADYYEQTGDYKTALEYRNLEKETKLKISKESNSEALLQADKDFYLNQKDREAAQYRSQLYYALTIGATILFIIIIFAVFVWRDRKKGKAEIKHQADKYDEMKDILLAMGSEYPAIEAEIKSMLEDD